MAGVHRRAYAPREGCVAPGRVDGWRQCDSLSKSWSCVCGKAKCNCDYLGGSIRDLVRSAYLKIMFTSGG